MHLSRKLRHILESSVEMKRLYLEAYLNLAWARLLILLPFFRIAPGLGKRMEETPFVDHPEEQKELKQIARAIRIMSGHTFWKSLCLVRAIAAMKMLRRRNISCTLYLGVAKDEHGKMIAHAMLRSGTRYVTGWGVGIKFTIVGKFAQAK